MNALFNRSSIVGTIVFIAALMFSSIALAQEKTWRIFALEDTTATYPQNAPWCSAPSATCIPTNGLEICINGSCATTGDGGEPDGRVSFTGLAADTEYQACLQGTNYAVMSGSAGAPQDAPPDEQCVSYTTPSVEDGDDNSTVMYVEMAEADINITGAITSPADPLNIVAGQDAWAYTFTVTNDGPADATNVVVDWSVIPGGTVNCDVVEVYTESQGTFASPTWNVGSLANGASATLDYVCSAIGADTEDGATRDVTLALTSLDQVDPTDPPDGPNNTATLNAAFVRVSDLSISKTDLGEDPAVAGTNMSYTITVTNNGPSDAAAVTVVDELPHGTTYVSDTASYDCTPDTPVAGSVSCLVGIIADGGSPSFEIELAIDATLPHATVLLNEVVVSSDSIDPEPGNNGASEETSVIRVATWDVTKEWEGGEVPVQLTCDGVPVDDTVTSGKTATLTHTGFADDVNCVVTETVPPGEAPTYVGDCDVASTVSGNGYSCLITNNTSEVRIHAYKMFSDDSDDEVMIKVECNDGFISQDGMAPVTGGDLAGHTFIINDFIDGELDCTVTESGSPSGYAVTPIDGYTFTDMASADVIYTAFFYNAAMPATYTVTKEWTIVNEGGNAVMEEVYVTIECDSPIDYIPCNGGGSSNACADSVPLPPYTKSDWLGDGDTLTASVSTYTGDAMCKAYEDIVQSGVESENGCESFTTLSAGEEYGCKIKNSVFFEGIPTLSQWGMALMALLMLGVGLVGFRRFA
jgi:uncharacterized repeat protein (TIGR01451 family)